VSPPLEPIKFQFSDDWLFGVPPEDYMIDYVEPGVGGQPDQSYCILGVSGGNFGLYILGDSFLRSFLTVYDFETQQVGIAIHAESQSDISVNTNSSNKGWAIPLILVVTFLILLTIGIYFYRKYKREQVRRNL